MSYRFYNPIKYVLDNLKVGNNIDTFDVLNGLEQLSQIEKKNRNMYIVICSNKESINLSTFDGLNWDNIIFGPFESKTDAEEWVDNSCGKSYFSIIKINAQTTT